MKGAVVRGTTSTVEAAFEGEAGAPAKRVVASLTGHPRSGSEATLADGRSGATFEGKAGAPAKRVVASLPEGATIADGRNERSESLRGRLRRLMLPEGATIAPSK
jgi:hypothetical protein